MTDHVKVSDNGAVMEIIWSRAEKRNALSNPMYRAATAALNRAGADGAIRAVIVGSDSGNFTSGNDLADFAAAASGGEPPAAWAFIEAIAKFPKPLIAAVPGLAVGVGTTMLLHCDLVFVAHDARLTTPFVNLALAPEAASSLLLPACIGHQRAFAMFALGEALSGDQAAAMGLANAAMPAAAVLGAAREAAGKLAKMAPGAVASTKRLMRQRETILTHMQAEGAVFAERLVSAEAMEAFTAFQMKRPADFSQF